jgi:hypothetical protein
VIGIKYEPAYTTLIFGAQRAECRVEATATFSAYDSLVFRIVGMHIVHCQSTISYIRRKKFRPTPHGHTQQSWPRAVVRRSISVSEVVAPLCQTGSVKSIITSRSVAGMFSSKPLDASRLAGFKRSQRT